MIAIDPVNDRIGNTLAVRGHGAQIITPRLWGGYELPMIAGTVRPVYHPAINQIWIDRSSLPNEEVILALAHEAMHVYTISLQPSQLIPLRAELLGYIDRPDQECFDELVETVCEASFWGLTRLGMGDIRPLVAEAKYQQSLAMLFDLARYIAGDCDLTQGNEPRLKEAVVGICLFLMHVVPHRAGLGQEIILRLFRFPVPLDWQSRWDVFRYYYAEVGKECKRSKRLQKRISLVLPMDVHRCIGDMLVFLSAALKVVRDRPWTITAVLPTLLLLATQGSFMLLPVIRLKNTDDGCTAEIRLIHNTSKARRTPSRVADLQRSIYMKDKDKGLFCGAAPIFVALVEISRRFASSSECGRIAECFRAILSALPHLLRAHMGRDMNCDGCKKIFQGDIFNWAFETMVSASRADWQAIVDTAKCYEGFLLGEAMNVIQDTWGLPEKPRPIRHYRFI